MYILCGTLCHMTGHVSLTCLGSPKSGLASETIFMYIVNVDCVFVE